MQVIIENSDSRIWHLEKVLADLILSAQTNDKVTVVLNGEGPCAESLGLYSLLDFVCEKINVPPQKFTISTWNQIEKHPYYQITRHAPFKGIEKLQTQLKKNPPPYKKIDDDTKHFGSFVGHGNRLRLAISSFLYYKQKDKLLQSYHTDVKNPYFDQFIGLEEMMFNDYSTEQIDMAYDFLKNTPLKLDSIVSYPILHEEKVYDILDYYPRIFVDIVNQTYFTGNTFFLDDKFWRSVITKTPFIVQGPRNFLKNLKRLGFKTFDRWWDEGYSEDPPNYQVKLILENIDFLAGKSLTDLSKMYDEMTTVLDHNYNVFMSLVPSSFKESFND